MELKGKTINFLGDSITEGHGVEDLENNRYDNVIKKKYSLEKVRNYGIGGTRLAHQANPSSYPAHDLCFCGRAYRLNPDADIIVVYGGINDYMHGDAPFGKTGDTTPATFCGAVEFLMSFLKTTYANSKIVFVAPAHCACDGIVDSLPSQNPCKASDAKPLVDYVDEIINAGARHDIPVLDLYRTFCVDPNNASDKEKYTADGLHFNDAGHKLLADCIADFLKSL